MATSGFKTLHLFVSKGRNLRSTELWGAMSPYVTVSMVDPDGKRQHLASRALKGAGDNAEFNCHFKVRYAGESHLWINVMGEKVIKGPRNDASGWAKLSFDPELRSRRLQHVTLHLEYKQGKPAGTLAVAFKFSKTPIAQSTWCSYGPNDIDVDDDEPEERKPQGEMDAVSRGLTISTEHSFKSVRMVIHSALNLPRCKDPYCTVSVGDKTAESENFEFSTEAQIRAAFVMPYINERELIVRFYEKERANPIGSVKVDLLPFFKARKSRGGRMMLALKCGDEPGTIDCSIAFSEQDCERPAVITLSTVSSGSSESSDGDDNYDSDSD